MNDDKTRKFRIALLFTVGILPFELNGFYNPSLDKLDSQAVFWAVEILSWVILPIIIYWLARRLKLFTFHEVGYHFDLHGKEKSIPFFTGLFLFPFMFYYGFLTFRYLGANLFDPASADIFLSYNETLPGEGPLRFIKVFYFAASAGLVEEFYYRGMFKLLFNNTRLQLALYVIISAVIFSSVHWENGITDLFLTTVIGLMAALCYLWTKNLWPLALAHFFTDFRLFY